MSAWSQFKFDHNLTLLTINRKIHAREIKEFLRNLLDPDKTNIPDKTEFILFSGCHGTPKGEMIIDQDSEQFIKDLTKELDELYKISGKNYEFPDPIRVGRKEGGKMKRVSALAAALMKEMQPPSEELAKKLEDLIKVLQSNTYIRHTYNSISFFYIPHMSKHILNP